MIGRLKGKVVEKNTNYLLLDVNGICYEVFLPVAVMQRLEDDINTNGEISLVTYHYYQVDPAKSIPVLIGFANEIEKEFFLSFISVSGIGPRAALKAMNQPISLIAKAIHEADMDFLRTLPGIGQQKARDIIAKLQDKVGKFGLIKDNLTKEQLSKDGNIIEEAVAVLMQLEYKKSEAMQMVKKAMERKNGVQSTEELLNEVYKQRMLK
ncbi:MAG: Holliday junction branch migration protein RuvA [Candidatus Omnitrophica bacterium]|jgi:Holliday junction DNA helicase RuvA|nr:Holliday junction branch migration protein RuvA [Candidatus Omnitrophota bacterium]